MFVDAERRSRDEAFGLAKATLAELNEQQVPFSDAPRHGDRFPYFVNYVERDPQFVASHFGAPMAEQVFATRTRLIRPGTAHSSRSTGCTSFC